MVECINACEITRMVVGRKAYKTKDSRRRRPTSTVAREIKQPCKRRARLLGQPASVDLHVIRLFIITLQYINC